MPRDRKVARGATKKTEAKKRTHGRRARGAAARDKVDQELAKQKAREEDRKNRAREPFRFRLETGESREVIIVDDEPDFMMYEHAGLKHPDTGHWNVNLPCIKDYDNCPICEHAEKESTWCLYLTVIDTKEFEDRKGNVHEFSKKLFVVKTNQIKKFTRRFEKDGTLRGARFELTRDGQKDPVIGSDIDFIEYVDEDELLEYEREWEDKDGKMHLEKCHEPFDYDELFPELDEEECAERYDAIFGTSSEPAPGSRRANERTKTKRRRGRDEEEDELDEEDDYDESDDDDDDEPPWDEEDDSEESEDDSEEDEEDGDEEEEEEKPRRKPRRPARKESAEKPKRKTTRRRR